MSFGFGPAHNAPGISGSYATPIAIGCRQIWRSEMLRRQFIVGLGGSAATAAWPVVARAQRRTPVVGVLSMGAPEMLPLGPSFVQALKESGFVEGQNVTFEFRYAFQQFDRLPALATDLVGQRVDVIYTAGLPGAIAAKAASSTVPIVFVMGEDPVKEGIVASLNRPGGNATGFSGFNNQLMAKRLDLLRQAVPRATAIGFLMNPDNPNAGPDTKDARDAALARGLTLRVLTAASEVDFEQVFATISHERIGALLVGVEPFFWGKAQELIALAARRGIPALYDRSIFPAAGGLMSYGTSYTEAYRLAGLYVSRILKGAKPADLPVVQSTKFEFSINLKTARTLGLDISPQLTALADEVIE
jgi:putative tryptophan/tyrosine transport system substrate-binding protein